MGVTVCAASGDDGSSDGVSDGQPHVDFPASSLYVLGCGGTTLSSSANRITEEDAWDDLANGGGASGGGVSVHFPLPTWQQAAYVPRRPTTGPDAAVPTWPATRPLQTGHQSPWHAQSAF